jgi:hypothetical protein
MFTGAREYKLLRCTQLKVFKATMTSLMVENKAVLLSVVENFIADAFGPNTLSLEKEIKECIDDYINVVMETALRLPETKFEIVLPLGRPWEDPLYCGIRKDWRKSLTIYLRPSKNLVKRCPGSTVVQQPLSSSRTTWPTSPEPQPRYFWIRYWDKRKTSSILRFTISRRKSRKRRRRRERFKRNYCLKGGPLIWRKN